MPIEIKELTVKVVVEEKAFSNQNSPIREQEIVDKCVEKVMKQLKRDRKR